MQNGKNFGATEFIGRLNGDIELDLRFPEFKDQFNLPAHTIDEHNLLGIEPGMGDRGYWLCKSTGQQAQLAFGAGFTLFLGLPFDFTTTFGDHCGGELLGNQAHRQAR